MNIEKEIRKEIAEDYKDLLGPDEIKSTEDWWVGKVRKALSDQKKDIREFLFKAKSYGVAENGYKLISVDEIGIFLDSL
jgi:hypothetical protein